MYVYSNTVWRRGTGKFEVDYEIPPRGQVPSAHAICTWVRNFEETGSALKKKPSGRVLSVRIPENIDAVVRSPRRSARKIASSLGLGRRSVQRILHNLQFHPCKLQIVQELKPNDSVLRLQFCENLLAKIKEDANCEMDST
jgi:transposase